MNWFKRVVFEPLAAYKRRLLHVFGWRFLAFLFTSQTLLKGMLLYVVTGVMLPLFKNMLNVDAAYMQILTMIVMVPWSIKPILGLISDFVSINGLHKKPLLLQSLAIGCIGAGVQYLFYGQHSALGLSLCFAGIMLEISVFDLMSEAAFSARMRVHDARETDPNMRTGSDIVTLSQMMQTGGGIAATLFVGILADLQAYKVMMSVILGLCVIPLVPTLLGWIREDRDHEEDEDDAAEEPDEVRHCCWGHIKLASKERMRRQRGVLFVIAFMGIAAPVTAVITTVGDPAIALCVAVLFTVAVVVGTYMVFPRLMGHIALYQVLRSVSSPSVGSGLDYFYLAGEDCVPGGPAFSYTYYMLVAGLVGYGAMFVGTIIYQTYLTKFNYRSVLLVTTILSALAGLSDLFIITRTNIRLGLPDKWAYLMGEAIMEPVIGMLNTIPIATLLSKSVPNGLEACAFALLAGVSNFAGMIRELSGALLFDVTNLQTVVPCNFNALPWLVLSCHVLGPLVVGVAVSWLIPNVAQTADVQDQTEMIEFQPVPEQVNITSP
jgi:hypothetical protein